MTLDFEALIGLLYLLVATFASIPISLALNKKLRKEAPGILPYRWGFYFGCMGIACLPVAVLTGLAAVLSGSAGAKAEVAGNLGWSLFFTVQAICGWFVIKRRRWAWVLGTLLNLNVVTWIINSMYFNNRWHEFQTQNEKKSSIPESEAKKLLADATELEMQDRIEEAIAMYQRVMDEHPQTYASQAARKCIENLRPKAG